jgi:hypothetical protein
MSAVTAEAAAYVVSKKYMSSYYDTTSKNVFKNSDYDRLYLPRTNHKSNIEVLKKRFEIFPVLLQVRLLLMSTPDFSCTLQDVIHDLQKEYLKLNHAQCTKIGCLPVKQSSCHHEHFGFFGEISQS